VNKNAGKNRGMRGANPRPYLLERVMSNKMNYIPFISSYENIRQEMNNDLR